MVDLGQKKVNICSPFFMDQIEGGGERPIAIAVAARRFFLSERILACLHIPITKSNGVPSGP